VVSDKNATARFEREVRPVAAISHPNILAIHDFQRDGETVYAVMEFLDGRTLREMLIDSPLSVCVWAARCSGHPVPGRPITGVVLTCRTESERRLL
jgi:serine/threonine protein kinase